jgi:hypothetical protein
LGNNPKRRTENNIRANWLLREIADQTESEFKKLDKDLRMRANGGGIIRDRLSG